MQTCPSQDLTLPITSYFSGEGTKRDIVQALGMCVCVCLSECICIYN